MPCRSGPCLRGRRPGSALGGCRCRCGRRAVGQLGANDLATFVDLEHVAFLHVVEVLEQDAALETLLHLADVVLEAAQLPDSGVVDDRALAEYAHVRAAANDAARDVRAGDGAEPRDPEQLPDLRLA